MRVIRFGTNGKPFQVAVYLGSFNPIHRSHIQLARQARGQQDLQMDAVEVMPLARPVHKVADFMSDADRLEITRLGLQGETKLFASDADMMVTEPTLAQMKQEFPGDERRAKVKLILRRTLAMLDRVVAKYHQLGHKDVELNYIVGADGMAGYPDAWQEPEYAEFVKRCRFLIAPRPGATPVAETVAKLKAIYPAFRAAVSNVIPSSISSSDIRKCIVAGKPIPAEWVPPAVAKYLWTHRARLFPSPAKSA